MRTFQFIYTLYKISSIIYSNPAFSSNTTSIFCLCHNICATFLLSHNHTVLIYKSYRFIIGFPIYLRILSSLRISLGTKLICFSCVHGKIGFIQRYRSHRLNNLYRTSCLHLTHCNPYSSCSNCLCFYQAISIH